MDEKELQEHLDSVPPEERAAAWEEYVRNEVNSLLDIFLPEAISGNVGVKYDHPVKKIDPRTGRPEIDEDKANGVQILVMFEFAGPVQFFGETKPEPEKVE